MSEVSITAARGKLSTLVDDAQREPVFLTRRDRDIRAVDAAWEEADRLGEIPIPWKDAKRNVGLA